MGLFRMFSAKALTRTYGTLRPRLALSGATVVVAFCGALVGVIPLGGADAEARYLSAVRAGSPAEQISYLNAQRVANGIPGGLRNIKALSLGCYQYENLYVRSAGQYPHQEVPGQAGYTQLGNLAAGLSELADGVGSRPLWGNRAIDNAWANAPLHLVSLFNPTARYAWFGAGPFGACMGAASDNPLSRPAAHLERSLRSSEFFSLPGDGTSGVWPLQVANDLPFTPQEAVHIPAGQPTGPNIILFPEASRARLARVDLVSARGRAVAVRVVTPATPTPPFPAGWPAVKLVGEQVGNVCFVIPTRPLRGGTRYALTALWRDGTGGRYAQRVRFKTGPRSHRAKAPLLPR